jgi:two-component system phosphate regulon sensor histidine kinase PhoR
VADSEESPAAMENHADRPEIMAAAAGRTGRSIRYSYTLKKDMMYVAVPVVSNGKPVAVVRTSTPVSLVTRGFLSSYNWVNLLAVLVLVFVLLTSAWVYHRLKRAFAVLQHGVEQYGQGRLEHKIYGPPYGELDALAGHLNRMADRIKQLLDASDRQARELESLFANMEEGILVVDNEERILRINTAAAGLFGLEPNVPIGRSIQETLRHGGLIHLIQKTLAAVGPVEETLRVLEPVERVLQGRGTVLRTPAGEKIGALVVLNDITRLARLETIRKDFVANVSHELKTPVTSIQGFVETLRDGAWKDEQNAVRFLDTIARHVDRLNALIDDLLDLSRIEQTVEKSEMVRRMSPIFPILENAVAACSSRAKAKNIRVRLTGDEQLKGPVNATLLEQAVFNLIDNAVKYSGEGTDVDVHCEKHAEEITIRVTDRGPGITKKHLPRIFERFYRVDPARSRDMGGTGLGLSIVKHIVQGHGGSVDVESTAGKGSTFTIVLPLHRLD